MTLEELNRKLNALRNKWIGKVPKPNDPNWWRFNCDRCLATKYKTEIKILMSKEENLTEVAELIFGKN